MSDSVILALGIAAFTVIVLVLVAIILFAKSKLVDSVILLSASMTILKKQSHYLQVANY